MSSGVVKGAIIFFAFAISIALYMAIYNAVIWRRVRSVLYPGQKKKLWSQWTMIWKYMGCSNDISDGRKIFIWPIFDWFIRSDHLNACATSLPPWDPGKAVILFNHVWIAIICFEGNTPIVKRAFEQSLYHEICHLHYDFLTHWKMSKRGKISKEARKFALYINEVYCDFYGTQHSGYDREDEINIIIDFKVRVDQKLSGSSFEESENREVGDHPSWKKRREWLLEGMFDDRLIKRIAKETGFCEEGTIDELCRYFKDIRLRTCRLDAIQVEGWSQG